MLTHDQLTDEERSILTFAEADFRKRHMHLALAMARNPDIKPIELRMIIDSYRERWRRYQQGHLKLVR